MELDEANEKILNKLDDTIGLSKNKEVLRDIIKYHKVIKQYDCNIKFENYNIVIRNEKNVSIFLNKDKKLKEKKENEIVKTGLQELDELIGLDEVKEQIKKVISFVKTSKKRNNMPMLYMCFNGHPGTGKTTVARIVGKIFAEEQILSDKKVFVEAQRCDLIGKYVGHTAPMTQKMIEKSYVRSKSRL